MALQSPEEYLASTTQSVSEISTSVRSLKETLRPVSGLLPELESILVQTSRVENLILGGSSRSAHQRVDESLSLSFCNSQLKSLSAMVIATQPQLDSDEDTLVSFDYISSALGNALSTLSEASIIDTGILPRTRHYKFLGRGSLSTSKEEGNPITTCNSRLEYLEDICRSIHQVIMSLSTSDIRLHLMILPSNPANLVTYKISGVSQNGAGGQQIEILTESHCCT